MPNQSPQDRNAKGGDVTKSAKIPTPAVIPTTSDNVNDHGPGEWDNEVYQGDPYGSSVPTDSFDSAAGPA